MSRYDAVKALLLRMLGSKLLGGTKPTLKKVGWDTSHLSALVVAPLPLPVALPLYRLKLNAHREDRIRLKILSLFRLCDDFARLSTHTNETENHVGSVCVKLLLCSRSEFWPSSQPYFTKFIELRLSLNRLTTSWGKVNHLKPNSSNCYTLP